MKKILFFILLINIVILPQTLSGKKIALDPGHGSPSTATCEPETKRFETYINHIVVPYLKKYLQNSGATIYTTRADFDSLGPCLTLSEREYVANSNNVHYFQSVHHNAFDGNANYTLGLFEQLNTLNCPAGNPQWPGQADVMSGIIATKINAALQTTAAYNRGDLCFLGFNLGVLNDAQMPASLSEASFFDNVNERKKLKNLDYLRTEAEAIYLSFLQYYNVAAPSHGSLVGFVRRQNNNNPVNGVTVKIASLNKTYITDSFDNGFYRLDSIQPGTYTITATGTTDTATYSVTVNGGVINVKNIFFQELVGNVKMFAALSGTESIRGRWYRPTGSIDSFYVYLSEDGITFDPTPVRKLTDTTVTITGLTPGKVYYVKVKAKNQLGISEEFSKTYGASVSSDATKVLLVDGFNRFGGSGSFTTFNHNLVRFFGKAFKENNVRFETITNSAINSASELNSYKYVVWMLGDESTIDETFSDKEQLILKAYLNGGGKLFVSGSEVAWDLGNKGTATDKEFLTQYLKADYVADNPTPNTPVANGVAGSIFDGLTISFGQNYPEDYPDVITPVNGGIPVMKYNATQVAAVSYEGLFPAGTKGGKLVYMAYPYETIGADSTRNKILLKLHTFLSSPVDVKEENIIPGKYSISVYPNPFNPTTNVMLNVTEAGKYKIEVYNVLGQKVNDLYNGELNTGNHSFNLNMINEPSGVYIIRAESGSLFLTNKIMLLK